MCFIKLHLFLLLYCYCFCNVFPFHISAQKHSFKLLELPAQLPVRLTVPSSISLCIALHLFFLIFLFFFVAPCSNIVLRGKCNGTCHVLSFTFSACCHCFVFSSVANISFCIVPQLSPCFFSNVIFF